MKNRIKSLFCTGLFFLLTQSVFSQSNAEKFAALSQRQDTVRMRSLLRSWNTAHPEDPELYVSGMNYYVKSKARHAMDSAIAYARRGIARFPTRLDMRFGMIYILGEAARYNEFTTEIINTLDVGHAIGNEWYWAENKKVEQPDTVMIESVQTYLLQLYATEDDRLLSDMNRVGIKTLSYYPDAVKILSTTAVANLVSRNYDSAMEYLRRAEKLAPTDFVVLGNLAKAYDLQNDTALAIRYYELVGIYGDEQARSNAALQVSRLKSR